LIISWLSFAFLLKESMRYLLEIKEDNLLFSFNLPLKLTQGIVFVVNFAFVADFHVLQSIFQERHLLLNIAIVLRFLLVLVDKLVLLLQECFKLVNSILKFELLDFSRS
jgi:hypothetical protein